MSWLTVLIIAVCALFLMFIQFILSLGMNDSNLKQTKVSLWNNKMFVLFLYTYTAAVEEIK